MSGPLILRAASTGDVIDHLNAYALVVKDVKACAEFYRDKVGLKLQDLEEDFAYLTFERKGMPGVALVGRKGFTEELPETPRPGETQGYRSYFAAFVEDADQLYEELRAKGVHFVKPPTTRPNGQRYAYFEDPEQNLWEISHFPK